MKWFGYGVALGAGVLLGYYLAGALGSGDPAMRQASASSGGTGLRAWMTGAVSPLTDTLTAVEESRGGGGACGS